MADSDVLTASIVFFYGILLLFLIVVMRLLTTLVIRMSIRSLSSSDAHDWTETEENPNRLLTRR